MGSTNNSESFNDYISRIREEINSIESEGFVYLQDWQGNPYIPDRVALPDGRILDESELISLLENSPRDPILRKARRLIDLYFTEGLEDDRFFSPSFLNSEDEKLAREKYSKHVKALFQVSGKRTNNFNTVLGYPVEFIPVNNPYDLSKGDKLSLRLLKEGKPLTNQMVHFSNRFNSENHSPVEKSTRTNKNGILTIELDQVGRWYVATIDMVESDEENIDYVSNWATLTFEIR